ncbi:MAG: enoyl-ACP reductase [Clostridia bacterium]
MHKLLEGKKGLVLGVANANSIAWAVAQKAAEAGAELAITCQNERFERKVRTLVEDSHMEAHLYRCDATEPEDLRRLFQSLDSDFCSLDFALHAWAFAPPAALKGDFVDTTWDDFATAHRVSTHSLVEISRGLRDRMNYDGSILALTYLGAERVAPGYNVMGVAKAALEASVRYLASDLGSSGIRVNAISPGPISTLSARGVPGFTEMLKKHREIAPLGRNVEADEVGNAAVFLFSDLSTAITGQVLYVDAGYSIMGV